jgi:hypothetical protein
MFDPFDVFEMCGDPVFRVNLVAVDNVVHEVTVGENREQR